jgi:drug/metabolite transporter (DMT)-like permease
MARNQLRGHLLTLLTALVWGVTFISTKVLLRDLSPVEILFYRFCIGFLVLLALHPQIVKASVFKDELLFALLSLCGVVLYFLMENTALKFTQAANVGLIVAIVPVFTALAAHLTTPDEKLSGKLMVGSGAALAGVFLVVLNGSMVLQLNPTGDLLAVLAAAAWAVYSVLLKKVNPGLNTFYVTGRVFLYGIVLVIPLVLLFHDDFLPNKALSLINIGNLLFLGLLASALCYVFWNKAVQLIGVIKTSNYLYLIPLIAMAASVLILHEKVNGIMLFGGLLILSGVYISEKGSR